MPELTPIQSSSSSSKIEQGGRKFILCAVCITIECIVMMMSAQDVLTEHVERLHCYHQQRQLIGCYAPKGKTPIMNSQTY